MVGAPEGSAQGERAIIGRGRAREVVVNIVLPFAYAWAEANQQSELAEQALALYRGYPPSGGNEITRGSDQAAGRRFSRSGELSVPSAGADSSG